MSRRSHPRRSNRRELSQNFLRDPQVITQMCDLLAGSSLPVLDLGAGAVTGELVRRGFRHTRSVPFPRWTAACSGSRGGRPGGCRTPNGSITSTSSRRCSLGQARG